MSWAKGIGSAVREVRLHMCQKGAASAGARDFVSKYYQTLKEANPSLPVLIRECSGTPAQLQARFAKGREEHLNVNGKSAEDIKQALVGLAKAN